MENQNIEITTEVVIMKYLTLVFENDAETVASVLASMGETQRETLIDQVLNENLSESELLEIQETFNKTLEALNV